MGVELVHRGVALWWTGGGGGVVGAGGGGRGSTVRAEAKTAHLELRPAGTSPRHPPAHNPITATLIPRPNARSAQLPTPPNCPPAAPPPQRTCWLSMSSYEKR